MDEAVGRAVEALYVADRDALHRYALGLTGGSEEARDLVAEAFLRAVSEPRFAEPGFNGRAWLFRVVTNLSRNLWTRYLNRFVVHPLERLAGSGAEPTHEEAERRESLAGLTEALAGLSARDREIVCLKYFEDMSYREIADATGAPEGTVASRLARALGRLNHALGT